MSEWDELFPKLLEQNVAYVSSMSVRVTRGTNRLDVDGINLRPSASYRQLFHAQTQDDLSLKQILQPTGIIRLTRCPNRSAIEAHSMCMYTILDTRMQY